MADMTNSNPRPGVSDIPDSSNIKATIDFATEAITGTMGGFSDHLDFVDMPEPLKEAIQES